MENVELPRNTRIGEKSVATPAQARVILQLLPKSSSSIGVPQPSIANWYIQSIGNISHTDGVRSGIAREGCIESGTADRDASTLQHAALLDSNSKAAQRP